jgi:hypothetical protein
MRGGRVRLCYSIGSFCGNLRLPTLQMKNTAGWAMFENGHMIFKTGQFRGSIQRLQEKYSVRVKCFGHGQVWPIAC